MDGGESDTAFQLHKKAYQIFSDFMTRISEEEELVSVGNSLLVNFRHQLGRVRSFPLDKTSKMVDAIIKANETKRMKAYLENRCLSVHDGVQILSNLNTCQEGFLNHLRKARDLFDEIDRLMNDMVATMETANKSLIDEHSCDGLVHQTEIDEKEEIIPAHPKKHDAADYAAMMAVIYGMLKQDYTMQERILFDCLKLSTSLEKLDSYCQMWSLRPYINDNVMREAWRYIP